MVIQVVIERGGGKMLRERGSFGFGFGLYTDRHTSSVS